LSFPMIAAEKCAVTKSFKNLRAIYPRTEEKTRQHIASEHFFILRDTWKTQIPL